MHDERLKKAMGSDQYSKMLNGMEFAEDFQAEHFDFNNNKQLLMLNINRKDETEKGDIKRVARMMSYLRKVGQDGFQNVAISFDGYQDTMDEIWQIPKIRMYCRKIITKYPHIFYFFNPFFETTKNMLLCIGDVNAKLYGERIGVYEAINRDVNNKAKPYFLMEVKITDKQYKDIKHGLISFGKNIGDLEGAKKVLKEIEVITGREVN